MRYLFFCQINQNNNFIYIHNITGQSTGSLEESDVVIIKKFQPSVNCLDRNEVCAQDNLHSQDLFYRHVNPPGLRGRLPDSRPKPESPGGTCKSKKTPGFKKIRKLAFFKKTKT